MLIESIDEIKRKSNVREEAGKIAYRLPSDRYVQEAIGFESLPDNIPYDDSMLMSDNFVRDILFTTKHPVNPNRIQHSNVNPLDLVKKKQENKYIEQNALEYMTLDNLLNRVNGLNSNRESPPLKRNNTYMDGTVFFLI